MLSILLCSRKFYQTLNIPFISRQYICAIRSKLCSHTVLKFSLDMLSSFSITCSFIQFKRLSHFNIYSQIYHSLFIRTYYIRSILYQIIIACLNSLMPHFILVTSIMHILRSTIYSNYLIYPMVKPRWNHIFRYGNMCPVDNVKWVVPY